MLTVKLADVGEGGTVRGAGAAALCCSLGREALKNDACGWMEGMCVVGDVLEGEGFGEGVPRVGEGGRGMLAAAVRGEWDSGWASAERVSMTVDIFGVGNNEDAMFAAG